MGRRLTSSDSVSGDDSTHEAIRRASIAQARRSSDVVQEKRLTTGSSHRLTAISRHASAYPHGPPRRTAPCLASPPPATARGRARGLVVAVNANVTSSTTSCHRPSLRASPAAALDSAPAGRHTCPSSRCDRLAAGRARRRSPAGRQTAGAPHPLRGLCRATSRAPPCHRCGRPIAERLVARCSHRLHACLAVYLCSAGSLVDFSRRQYVSSSIRPEQR